MHEILRNTITSVERLWKDWIFLKYFDVVVLLGVYNDCYITSIITKMPESLDFHFANMVLNDCSSFTHCTS